MTTRLCTIATVAALLALPVRAPAAGGFNPLLCEATGMRKEAQRYNCLGRCERRNDRRGSDPTDGSLTACQQICEERHAEAMEQLDQRDVCSGETAGPDPNKCQARLMRAGAAHLICQSQCGARAGSRVADSDACMQVCDQTYSDAIDRTMAKHFCDGQAAPTN
jgi:hypothetical protein